MHLLVLQHLQSGWRAWAQLGWQGTEHGPASPLSLPVQPQMLFAELFVGGNQIYWDKKPGGQQPAELGSGVAPMEGIFVHAPWVKVGTGGLKGQMCFIEALEHHQQ